MALIFSVFTNLIWTMTEILPKNIKTTQAVIMEATYDGTNFLPLKNLNILFCSKNRMNTIHVQSIFGSNYFERICTGIFSL